MLVTSTDTSEIDVDAANLQLAVKGLGTPSDAREDLKRKIHQTCSMPDPRVRNVRLLSKAEHDEMFRKVRGWTTFHKRYGEHARLEILSRVGFSANKHVAVFYASGGIGLRAGGCYFYVFELKNGQWVKRAESPVWNT